MYTNAHTFLDYGLEFRPCNASKPWTHTRDERSRTKTIVFAREGERSRTVDGSSLVRSTPALHLLFFQQVSSHFIAAAMFAASPEKTPRKKKREGESAAAAATNKKKITNSNTDRLCLDDNSSFFGRLWYHASLHNGLYMLDPTEKVALNTAGALFTVLTILYLWAFGRGFVDGFGASSTAGGAGLGVGVGQPHPLQQQQEVAARGGAAALLDPIGSGGGGGVRGDDLLSAALKDAASNAAAAAPLSPVPGFEEDASATGGAPNEL